MEKENRGEPTGWGGLEDKYFEARWKLALVAEQWRMRLALALCFSFCWHPSLSFSRFIFCCKPIMCSRGCALQIVSSQGPCNSTCTHTQNLIRRRRRAEWELGDQQPLSLREAWSDGIILKMHNLKYVHALLIHSDSSATSLAEHWDHHSIQSIGGWCLGSRWGQVWART
jgi:hypothetical protein